MSILSDILLAHKQPRLVFRRQIIDNIREEQTLFYAFLFGFLNFISFLPRLSMDAHLNNYNFVGMVAAQFVAFIFITPLAMYAIAGLSHFIVSYCKGRGNYAGSRRALFWAAVVTLPIILGVSILRVYIPQTELYGHILIGIFFFWQWFSNLYELEYSHV